MGAEVIGTEGLTKHFGAVRVGILRQGRLVAVAGVCDGRLASA